MDKDVGVDNESFYGFLGVCHRIQALPGLNAKYSQEGRARKRRKAESGLSTMGLQVAEYAAAEPAHDVAKF